MMNEGGYCLEADDETCPLIFETHKEAHDDESVLLHISNLKRAWGSPKWS